MSMYRKRLLGSKTVEFQKLPDLKLQARLKTILGFLLAVVGLVVVMLTIALW